MGEFIVTVLICSTLQIGGQYAACAEFTFEDDPEPYIESCQQRLDRLTERDGPLITLYRESTGYDGEAAVMLQGCLTPEQFEQYQQWYETIFGPDVTI